VVARQVHVELSQRRRHLREGHVHRVHAPEHTRRRC
jgi:hypothetical protein